MRDMNTMTAEPVTEPQTTTSTATMPPYNVVLLNDDDHTVEYVVGMVGDLFGHSPQEGKRIAREVHTSGRSVVATTNLEEAELKRDQIHEYGPDPQIPRCKGSMSAEVEQATR